MNPNKVGVKKNRTKTSHL